jgi:NADH dehydrogenase FAD-containing subunit
MADRPRVVIVGAGFGGLAAAKALASAPVEITVIDRRNYHLFQPLLYQVATAALSPADIAWPIRSILSRQENARVLMGEVTGVDLQRREVTVDGAISDVGAIGFDYLVLATGSRGSYFGHDAWEAYAPSLKTIADATAIRRHILTAFERAETEPDTSKRARLLTFAVIGGGPTGVELAGALAELARKALARDFHAIDPASARIVLIEAGPRILAAFPERLSAYSKRTLEKLGVEVMTETTVSDCAADGVTLSGGERLPAANVLWAAGVAASPAGDWLGAPTDRAGRVTVGDTLEVPDAPNVFVIGDTAAVAGPDGEPLPGTAPVAKQEGRYVARVIRARLAGGAPPKPFRYKDFGLLATIGRRAAVIDAGWLRMKGWIAWWLWGFAHIFFLIGMRNRVLVMVQWLWNYLTFQRGARLITGAGDD